MTTKLAKHLPHRARRCPVCRTALICPACAGAKGGRVLSAAKLEQLRAAARQPRPSAQGKPKPRREKPEVPVLRRRRDKPKRVVQVPQLEGR
jgi:hypothetical protein